jgi:hypothetical protein
MSDGRRRRRRNPLGSFGPNQGNVQEPCIRCFKPETNRGFMVDGDAEWTVAALHEFGGVPMNEALAMVQERYTAEGWTTDHREQTTVRLCRGCAEVTGAPVYALTSLCDGAAVRGVVQP